MSPHIGELQDPAPAKNASFPSLFPSIVSFSSRGYAVSFNSGRHPGWEIIPRSCLSSYMLCAGLDKRCRTLRSFSRGGLYPVGMLTPFGKMHIFLWLVPTNHRHNTILQKRCLVFLCFGGVWVKQRDPPPRSLLPKPE